METIKISVQNGQYVAKFSEKEVIELFGSDTIVTPYMASYPADKVLAEIRAKNPQCIVTLS